MDFTQIEHQAAVDGLKAAGNQVHIVRFFYLNNQNKICFFLLSAK